MGLPTTKHSLLAIKNYVFFRTTALFILKATSRRTSCISTHPRTFPNFFKNIAPESFVGDKIRIVEVILLLFLMMSNLENPTYFSSS